LPEKTNHRFDAVALIFAAAAGVISFLICRYVLGFITHVPDETSYMFQGRIFASGSLWLTPPPVPEGFRVDHILMTESRWLSIYPPAWPVLLSIGWFFGNPWIVNPIITCVAAIGVWRLAKIVFDKEVARFACALFCVSPFVLMMGSGQMAHMAALCAGVWSVSELFAAFQSEKRGRYFAAGILAGITFLIRPFSSCFILLPAFLWSLIRSPKRSGWSILGAVPFLIFFLTYNSYTFGDPFFAGYRHDSSWQPISFSFRFFFDNFSWYIRTLSGSLWRWPWPDLLILIPFIFVRPKTEFHWILIASCISLIFAFSLFSYRDIVYSGPRYAFEMIGFLCVFAAASLKVLLGRIQNQIIRLLIILPVLGLPFKALPQQFSHHFMMYHGQSIRFVQMLDEAAIGKNALILLAGDPYTLRTFMFLNALNPSEGERVFVRDLPDKRSEILKAFPRKEVWKFTIVLDPLPKQNHYVDRWRLEQASIVPVNKIKQK
jgi:hypothetical protein